MTSSTQRFKILFPDSEYRIMQLSDSSYTQFKQKLGELFERHMGQHPAQDLKVHFMDDDSDWCVFDQDAWEDMQQAPNSSDKQTKFPPLKLKVRERCAHEVNDDSLTTSFLHLSEENGLLLTDDQKDIIQETCRSMANSSSPEKVADNLVPMLDFSNDDKSLLVDWIKKNVHVSWGSQQSSAQKYPQQHQFADQQYPQQQYYPQQSAQQFGGSPYQQQNQPPYQQNRSPYQQQLQHSQFGQHPSAQQYPQQQQFNPQQGGSWAGNSSAYGAPQPHPTYSQHPSQYGGMQNSQYGQPQQQQNQQQWGTPQSQPQYDFRNEQGLRGMDGQGGHPPQRNAQDGTMESKLDKLETMGFSNRDLNAKCLRENNYELSATVQAILRS